MEKKKCNRRYMRNFLKKCDGNIILERFYEKGMIKEARPIYAVLYCSKCKIVVNLFKKSELNREQLKSIENN